MCLAVPAQVISLAGQEAEVDFGGVRRRISIVLTPDVRVGDYVLIHTGFAINVLDEEEARETLKLFQELDEFSAAAPEKPECSPQPTQTPPTLPTSPKTQGGVLEAQGGAAAAGGGGVLENEV